MTKLEDEVRGVRTMKRDDLPPIQVMPTNPDLAKMTKEQAVEWNSRYKKALEIGEEAKRKAMLKPGVEPTQENIKEAVAENQEEEINNELDEVRQRLAEATAEFEEDPKKPGLKAKITKLNKKLDKLEA